MKLQKVGGVASIANGILSLGLVFIFSIVFPRLGIVGANDLLDPVKGIAAWTASPTAFFAGDILTGGYFTCASY